MGDDAAAQTGDSIKVICRFRPLPAKSHDGSVASAGVSYLEFSHAPASSSVALRPTSSAFSDDCQRFTFDKIFTPTNDNTDIYNYIKSDRKRGAQEKAPGLIPALLEGYNCCFFAYGQTGAGKTFTMLGGGVRNNSSSDSDSDSDSDADADAEAGGDRKAPHPNGAKRNRHGVVQLLIKDLFSSFSRSPPSVTFTVKCSYVEVYLERVRDLLSPQLMLESSHSASAAASSLSANIVASQGGGARATDGAVNPSNLILREDPASGQVKILGVTQYYCSSRGDILALLEGGSAVRAVAETRMNADSSRSHSVFMITVEKKLDNASANGGGGGGGTPGGGGGGPTSATLYLVDLAGSESVGKTGASGSRLKEAMLINKSLSTLGNVINALCEGKPHVPYRDSKLTRLLSAAVGGNAKTCLIVCCSSEEVHFTESVSTLRFGSRAKKIVNQARINVDKGVDHYKKEVERAGAREKELMKFVEGLCKEMRRVKLGVRDSGGESLLSSLGFSGAIWDSVDLILGADDETEEDAASQAQASEVQSPSTPAPGEETDDGEEDDVPPEAHSPPPPPPRAAGGRPSVTADADFSPPPPPPPRHVGNIDPPGTPPPPERSQSYMQTPSPPPPPPLPSQGQQQSDFDAPPSNHVIETLQTALESTVEELQTKNDELSALSASLAVMQEKNLELQNANKKHVEDVGRNKREKMLMDTEYSALKREGVALKWREKEATMLLRQMRKEYQRLQKQISSGTHRSADALDDDGIVGIERMMKDAGMVSSSSEEEMDEDSSASTVAEFDAEFGEECDEALLTDSAATVEGDGTSATSASSSSTSAPNLKSNRNKSPTRKKSSASQGPGLSPVTDATKRELDLTADVGEMTRKLLELRLQLEEEKSNVQMLRDAGGASGDKKKIVDEALKLRRALERKSNDVQTALLKGQELHMTNKTLNRKLANRDQHVQYLEASLKDLQEAHRVVIIDNQREHEEAILANQRMSRLLETLSSSASNGMFTSGHHQHHSPSRIMVPIRGGQVLHKRKTSKTKNDGGEFDGEQHGRESRAASDASEGRGVSNSIGAAGEEEDFDDSADARHRRASTEGFFGDDDDDDEEEEDVRVRGEEKEEQKTKAAAKGVSAALALIAKSEEEDAKKKKKKKGIASRMSLSVSAVSQAASKLSVPQMKLPSLFGS